MRIVHTGSNTVMTLAFAKNYLKIDSDITIEDEVVQSAIDAAVDEASTLLMYTLLMDSYDVIMGYAEIDGDICFSNIKPVQRLDGLRVKKWSLNDTLVDVEALIEEDDYSYDIDADGVLTIVLTTDGKAKMQKGYRLVADVFAGLYATKDEIPASLVKAMLKMIADMVENRVDSENIKTGDWRSSDRQIWLRREWHF